MSKLRLAADLSLPPDAITQTFGILAVRGAGKTNTAAVMAEEMFEAGLPFVVVDPVGNWYGLRSSKDGRSPGLPVLIFGGRHGDIPLEKTAGTLIADLVVDQRLSCVLDVAEFSETDKIRFLIDFAERLYRRNQDPLHLFLEEADDYAPQRPFREQARLLRSWENIVRRGRARGLGITMITQRSAALNKNVLTQIETLIVLRTTAPNDRKAIGAWVEYHGQSKELLDSLPELEAGEAWVWSPSWLKVLKRVRIRRRETFDSAATPKDVKGRRPPATLADVDLGALQTRMAETIERAKSEDPRHLKHRVAELQRELAEARKGAGRQAAPAAPKEKRVEVQVIKDAQLTRLERVADRWLRGAGIIQEAGTSISTEVRQLLTVIAKVRGNGAVPPPPSREVRLPRPQRPAPPPPPHPRTDAGYPPRRHPRSATGDDDGRLGLAERKILSALAQYPQGRTTTQVAVLTGYSQQGGGFRNALGRLRTLGFVEGRGDLRITDAGVQALGDEWEPLPEPGEKLLAHWQGQLGLAEREILRVLSAAYPEALTAEEIAGRARKADGTPYESGGGGFRNALGRLRTLELVHGRGELRLSEDLVGGEVLAR